MAFLKQLVEKLESQKIYDGLMGKYETRFKVDGMEYAFLATSVGGDYSDNTHWMLEFENIKSHSIGAADNNKAVAKAFGEAVSQWVKEKNPLCFYTYGSSLESIKNIIESVKKNVKKYNLIDDSAEKKNEETGEAIEGNPVGKITWTKVLESEVVDTVDREALVSDKLEVPYEEIKDIKTDKSKMSGTSKTDKLDKGDKAYDSKSESFLDFKERILNEEVKNKDTSDEAEEEINVADTDIPVGQGLEPETAKKNVMAFLRTAMMDMKEVLDTSERTPENQLKIRRAMSKFYNMMAQRNPEEFTKLLKFTGDKVPEFFDKKIFGALQQVIGSEKEEPGDEEDMIAGFLANLDGVLSGEFQPSAVLNTGVSKNEPSHEFLQQRMKELGM
jgi:hypothetical protein